MRKIEEQMNNAIRHRKNWSGSNTTVRCYKKDGITTEVDVLLHGNCIAWFDTAWAPPEPICYRLREMFKDLHFSWFYDEPGMETAGYL